MFNYFFDQNPCRDSVMWIYQVTSYMLPVCLYADLMPSSYILLHISCYSVTRVFQNGSDLWFGKYGDCGDTQPLQIRLHPPF